METGDCKLCLSTGIDLRDSHFLPRSFYALLRTPDHAPVHLSTEKLYSSVKQIKDYVFCNSCEQCFGKAEGWIKLMLPQIGGPFPLRDRLMKQTPVIQEPDWALYETASNPEINVEKFMHFGIGVFYKGSVHPWNNGTTRPYTPLAPEDQEALRQYVLGNANLPKNMALIISVDSLPVVWQAMIQPYPAEPLQDFKHYLFYIPGILFQLLIGDSVQDAYPMSFNGNSNHPIILRDVSHMMRDTARDQTAEAKRPRKLEQLTAELDAKGLSIRLGH
jgi:hypothetical protein